MSSSPEVDNPVAGPDLPTDAFAESASEAFFFPADQHTRALDFLGHALWSSARLGVVIAEAGVGKTLVIRRLMQRLDDRYIAAAVHEDKLMPRDFLRQILAQYGIELEASDRSDLRRLLERYIHHHAGLGRTCVLVVENAQNMHPFVLEELRCLAGLQVEGKPSLKLLLLGQPSLGHVLDSPRMTEVLGPRVPRFVLGAFSEDQTAAYMAHRLRVAGATDPDAIVPASLTRQIHVRGRGNPGQINRICTRALQLLAEQGATGLTSALLDRAFQQLGMPPAQGLAEASATAQTSSQPGIAKLVLSLQGAEDRDFALDGGRVLIGRSEHADVRIDSTFVSRYHALIVREGNQDLLIDLGSTNGVLVGARRVVRRVLQHRDLIQMGQARLTYINMDARGQQPQFDPGETVCLSRPGFPSISDEPAAAGAVLPFGRSDTGTGS